MQALLLLSVVGLATYFLAVKSTAAKTLQMTIGGLRLAGNITLGGIPLTFIIKANNPTNEQFNFNSFLGALQLDGQDLVALNVIQNTPLAPNAITDIKVNTTLPWPALVQKGYTFYKGEWPKSVTIKGILTVGPIKIPVDQILQITQ